MALSMQEKQHVGKEVALRYLRARKKEKGIMLQEFCATTGYSPPYAAYLLRRYAKRVILGAVTLVPTRPSPWPRERKHVYGPAVVAALVWMYHLAGELCGKRLQAAMPELLRALFTLCAISKIFRTKPFVYINKFINLSSLVSFFL